MQSDIGWRGGGVEGERYPTMVWYASVVVVVMMMMAAMLVISLAVHTEFGSFSRYTTQHKRKKTRFQQ
jgi:hypothetical protein